MIELSFLDLRAMNATFFQTVLGIVTGILTTAFLYAIKLWWTRWFVPWFEERRYAGVIVAGPWCGNFWDDESNSIYVLHLKQSAHRISGTATVTFEGKFNNFNLDFTVSGQVWEGYLAIYLKPSNRRVMSYSTALLKIGGGGAHLQGQALFRNVNSECVDAHALRLYPGDVKAARQARENEIAANAASALQPT